MKAGGLWRFVPGALWAAFIFWGSSQQQPPQVDISLPHLDKLVHGGLFAVLTLLFLWADRGFSGWPKRWFWWPILASLYGVADEIHQLFVPQRSSEIFDVLADVSGAFAVALLYRWFVVSRHQLQGERQIR